MGDNCGHNIPPKKIAMQKRRRSRAVRPPGLPSIPEPKTPWYKRAWIIVTFVSSLLIGLLSQGPTLLSNAEKLPGEFDRVLGKFLSWHFDDSGWAGVWSDNPEGYVDSVDMKLSETDVKLHLYADRGRIGGEIAMKSICQVVPMFDYLLLEGSVSGNIATFVAFDHIGGRRENFFTFTAKREGVVMEVALKDGVSDWLPVPVRIAVSPPKEGEDPYEHMVGSCKAEKEEFLKEVRKLRHGDATPPAPTKLRKPVSELWYGDFPAR